MLQTIALTQHTHTWRLVQEECKALHSWMIEVWNPQEGNKVIHVATATQSTLFLSIYLWKLWANCNSHQQIDLKHTVIQYCTWFPVHTSVCTILTYTFKQIQFEARIDLVQYSINVSWWTSNQHWTYSGNLSCKSRKADPAAIMKQPPCAKRRNVTKKRWFFLAIHVSKTPQWWSNLSCQGIRGLPYIHCSHNEHYLKAA